MEEPPPWNKYFLQFIDYRGFANAGISGDQHQLRGAALDDAIKRGEQSFDHARPSVQLFGDQQPVGGVVFAKRKWGDARLTLPFGKTVPKVIRYPGGRLVALLGRL